MECAVCGEEIINECAVYRGGLALCRACAGTANYVAASNSRVHLQSAPRKRGVGAGRSAQASVDRLRRACTAIRPTITSQTMMRIVMARMLSVATTSR